jgi:hypothetical protein
MNCYELLSNSNSNSKLTHFKNRVQVFHGVDGREAFRHFTEETVLSASSVYTVRAANNGGKPVRDGKNMK